MKTVQEAWAPETSHEREAILLELERVLASPHFCNSKRYPALLRYIIDRALDGQSGLLKERTLGVEVFRRPPDYDTNTDTVVRYTAGEVRKRLSLYYHDHEPKAGFRISLPAGSYVPEFLREHELPQPEQELPAYIAPHADGGPTAASRADVRSGRRALWVSATVLLAVAIAGTVGFRQLRHRQNAMDQFWSPMLHDPATVLICIGGNVFDNNNYSYSGTITAGKETEYPFVSMQIASGIARVGGLIERNGGSFQIQSSASAPLSDLRDRPVVLLGAYNNPWTMRLLQPLRFEFPAEPYGVIADRQHPGRVWTRNRSQPYANADDYALIARFRDATTGNLVIALAGLGRNGTEAAAQFVTSPQYMQTLRERIGRSLNSGSNVEVVLKISVIGGKTGAPEIEEVYVW